MTLKREKTYFPGWRLSPDGKDYRLFEREEDVPEGWLRETPEGYVKNGPPAVEEPLAKLDPFDHDGDGKPGGSLPKEKRSPKNKVLDL